MIDRFFVTPAPFDQIVFQQRGFPFPVVEPVDGGRAFIASTGKLLDDEVTIARAEFLARSPEVAVHQLARLLNLPAGRA
jgi:hypothetical protein